jgi:hypothetical protein
VADARGAYALLQSTKPMTAAYGLSDLPVGLAGWIEEPELLADDLHEFAAVLGR